MTEIEGQEVGGICGVCVDCSAAILHATQEHHMEGTLFRRSKRSYDVDDDDEATEVGLLAVDGGR